MRKYVVPVLLRSAALTALWVGVPLLPGSEDPLAAGLLTFFAIMGAAGSWALVDGLKWSLPRLAICWLCSGTLLGVVAPWLTALQYDGIDLSAIGADTVDTLPLALGLVVVPAVAGGLLGLLLRPRTRPV